MATPEFIQKAYIAFFNRPADKVGYDFWLSTTNPDQDLLDLFSLSTEYLSDFADKNNREIIQIIYQNLFGREPEEEGWDYWEEMMDAGWVTVGTAAYEILGGAQNTDATIIANKAKAAQDFTSALDTMEKADAYAKAGDNGVGHLAKEWLNGIGVDNLGDALSELDGFLSELIAANPPIPSEHSKYDVDIAPTGEKTITLSTNENDSSTISWRKVLDQGKLIVENFYTTGHDTLDFTTYGAKWLGAANLYNGFAVKNIDDTPPALLYAWKATSDFPFDILNAGDKYITLTRPADTPSPPTVYMIELWTVEGSRADAYRHPDLLPTGEALDTAQLIGYVDLGYEIGLDVVPCIIF